ncbi:DUF6861 domain-containing protein [Dyella flagellata]|uniref:NAD(+)--protein-arginine ADP-ribosyltransferase Tre1-like N-terminal domain-containing protein n=1 Tax=Dyella flagellata TaxID=1867833 RepID=A0ABQ5XDV1_9GAMM|nr:hypothetical protein [Dyella flagellata]GLQ89401.1 hypothetical protein GCM10007898_29740 [Dyella flagellata]
MSDGMLDGFWNSLQRAEHRLEAEASEAEHKVYRTIYGYKSRVMRMRAALADSGPIARQTVTRKLEGISLDAVWDILFSAVRDMALYYGGSVVLGTAVGAGLGSLAGGVGAIPGAVVGAEAGNLLGEWVLMFLGLKMLAEGLADTIPQALRLYVQGFRIAWGPAEQDRPDAPYSADYYHNENMAAHRFADGHVLMIIAILIALIAYLTRGKSEKALMEAIRKSERLGSKFADWLAANKGKLLEDERLQPKLRERAQAQKEETRPLQGKRQGAAGSPKASDTPGADSARGTEVPDKADAAAKAGPKTLKPEYSPGYNEDSILNIPKGERPDPSTYLTQSYRDAHAALFEDGAVRIQPAAPTGTIGRTETWVFPKSLADDAIAKSGGDVRALENMLGLDEGYLGDAPVRVDIPNPAGYRIPTGNEFAANGFWRPGGATWPGGLPEAVIDPVPAGSYVVNPVFGD